MPNPKVTPVSISVRPLRVAHLCFEVDGILSLDGILMTAMQLGTRISPTPVAGGISSFDFAAFYARLGSMPTVAGDPSRLLYDYLKIQADTQPFTLASLRAENRKAVLDKAINARQNAYFAKYGHDTAIVSQTIQYYSSDPLLNPANWQNSKPNRLTALAGISNDQWGWLRSAYAADGLDTLAKGVVKTTSSHLTSNTTSYGYSGASGITDEMSTQDVSTASSAAAEPLPIPPGPWPEPSSWPPPAPQTPQAPAIHWGALFGGSLDPNVTIAKGASYQVVSSQDKAYQHQSITNTGHAYRAPYQEAAAQYERAQISLIDQQFAQFMYGQNLPNLTQVFRNEKNSIDSDVYRLQVAYLNTILMSPIPGVVTGIYKNPGDAVKAGEPVIRVENDAIVLLTMTLVYRGSITIGASVTVTTNLFDSPSLITIKGVVVAARGRSEDDHWEVIAQCDNVVGGQPLLPFGYHFDYDDTTVVF